MQITFIPVTLFGLCKTWTKLLLFYALIAWVNIFQKYNCIAFRKTKQPYGFLRVIILVHLVFYFCDLFFFPHAFCSVTSLKLILISFSVNSYGFLCTSMTATHIFRLIAKLIIRLKFKYICKEPFQTMSTHLGEPGKVFCLFNILDDVAKWHNPIFNISSLARSHPSSTIQSWCLWQI